MNPSLLSSISTNLIFRYSAALLRADVKWSAGGIKLPASHRLPHFGCFEGQTPFADCRGAWSESGLFFHFQISGKKQKPRCQMSRMLQSDGVQIWIDTRNVQTIHRASRFCHWFLYLPLGGESASSKPLGTMLRINRAKEDAKTFQMFKPMVASKLTNDGYELSCCIAANCLGGWNPTEHPRLGFNYAVVDGELGWQTLATDYRFPIAEDPSLWHTLELKTVT